MKTPEQIKKELCMWKCKNKRCAFTTEACKYLGQGLICDECGSKMYPDSKEEIWG